MPSQRERLNQQLQQILDDRTEPWGVIAAQPVAITLRYLQTLTEIASEKNSTIVFPLPIEMLHLLRQMIGGAPNASPRSD